MGMEQEMVGMKTQFSALPTEGRPAAAVGRFLAGLLEHGVVQAVLVSARQPHGEVVMPTLVADPARLSAIDPFAPVAWCNAATLLSSLTSTAPGERGRPVAALLRSCEVRAFIERVKLKQGSLDDLLLIGCDCLGRHENRVFLEQARGGGQPALDFWRRVLPAGGEPPAAGAAGPPLAEACTICVHPVADNVDLRFCLIGGDPLAELWLEGVSERGRAALATLGMA
ncbi:MAG: hypothetical protein FJ125_16110, partial [Deltaproteobacteria bacterium]|nr:hypothetical protein [Deltaproteobacteria bacterium]